MAGPIEIDVWQGELAELEVDALVVPASESLFMTTPAAAAVKRHGGEEIERAAVAQGPIPAGRAIATSGGSLAATYVIHAVGVGHDRQPDPERVRSAVFAALAHCEPLQLRRIAVAPIGFESGVFRPDAAADLLVESLLADPPRTLESIVIVAAHAADATAIREAIARRRARVS
jgi:O-acetyl-ADP-ribose deacetylase